MWVSSEALNKTSWSRNQDDQTKILNFCNFQVSVEHPDSGLQQTKKVPQDNLGKPSLTEPNILDNLQMSGPLWTVFVAKMAPFFSVIDGFDWFTLQKYMYHTPNFIHLQACNPRLQMMWHWLFQNDSLCSHIKPEAAHVVVARSPGQQCGSFN